MKKFKQTLAILLAVLMMVSSVPLSVGALNLADNEIFTLQYVLDIAQRYEDENGVKPVVLLFNPGSVELGTCYEGDIFLINSGAYNGYYAVICYYYVEGNYAQLPYIKNNGDGFTALWELQTPITDNPQKIYGLASSFFFTKEAAEKDFILFSAQIDFTPPVFDKNFNWTFNEKTGVLSIYCNGEMPSELGLGRYRHLIKSVQFSGNVKSISNYAFSGCTDLTSVTIPGSVTSIGDIAFSGCSSLTSIIIPDGVTSIGGEVFRGCTGLTSFTIPDSVISVGKSILDETPIYDNEENWKDGLFVIDNCLLAADREKATVKIPETTRIISDDVFRDFKTPENLIIPDSVVTIGDTAFEGCQGIKNITIGNGVKNIGAGAFECCSNLTDVTFGNSVEIIGSNAFTYCEIESIDLPESLIEIGAGAFEGCYNLTDVTFGNSVEKIGPYAFSNCKIENIDLPESLIEIDEAAFSGWGRLKSVSIPENVASLKLAFAGCWCLEEINVSENNKYYCDIDGVLFNKAKTELIHYPAAIEKSPLNYGAETSDLSYEIPSSVTKISDCAFQCNRTLGSVTIPGSVTYIGDECFRDTILNAIYYIGTAEQWNRISVNDERIRPILHFCPHEHTTETTTIPATCKKSGSTKTVCKTCGVVIENKTIPATGHADRDRDGYCDTCGADMVAICTHNCHKSGFMGFIWKIINFFNRIFGKDKYCECGAKHY